MRYRFVFHFVNQMNIVAFFACYFVFTSSTAAAGVQGRGLQWMVVPHGLLLVFVAFVLGIALSSAAADGITDYRAHAGIHIRLL